jgi:hypothetical protein
MNEHNRRPVDLNIDTSEAIDRVLSSFPADCVKDRGRLCMRISTVVARTEHNLKFGTPLADIDERVEEAIVAVEERCHDGITIDEDRRTTCGYNVGSMTMANIYPKWLFPDTPEVTDGDV